jgi:Protein of unknown function (DUF2975)
MAYERTDLLTATRSLLRVAQGVTVILMVCATVYLIATALLSAAGKPLPAFTGKLATMDPKAAMLAMRFGLIAAVIGGALLWPLLREVIRIIDSTRIGDPFVPENARRLRTIGWLLLAFNFCVGTSISSATLGGITFPGVSFSGVLTVLLVFVLARIFETGSQMRAELKETV